VARKAAKKDDAVSADDAPFCAADAGIEVPAALSGWRDKPAADGTRCMVTLSERALHLLDTAVLVDGHERSAVVEALILEHLADYYSGRKGRATVAPE
jgi:hypothetical protein